MQLYVTRLRLANWRNFKKVDIRLTRRAFFVGPNASGKSNLLDALRFLRNLVSVGGGLQAAVRDRGDISRIRYLGARSDPIVMLGVEIGDETSPALWRYELGFSGLSSQGLVKVDRETIWRDDNRILSRPDQDDVADNIRLEETAIERKSSNRDFREVAKFLDNIRYLHVVPQIVRDRDLLTTTADSGWGENLLQQIGKLTDDERQRTIDPIFRALQAAVPRLSGLKIEQDKQNIWRLKAHFGHWRPQAWQDERSLSDGTLRLIGILFSLVGKGGSILLEEPELSLHSAVIERLPAIFQEVQRGSGRQVLITTHSEKLLQDSGIGLDEIHMLIPGGEATEVVACSGREDIRVLVESGLTPGEAVMPKVAPPAAHQLSLLDLG